MNEFYLHKIVLATRTIIAIDNLFQLGTTYTYINGSPIITNGDKWSNTNEWTLGPVGEIEALRLAFLVAKSYNYDVMVNGKLLGLPYLGDPDQSP